MSKKTKQNKPEDSAEKPQTTVESQNTEEKMEFEIETNIPIPARRRDSIYPMDKLNPGNSFVLPKGTKKASMIVNYWKKRLPDREFIVRAIGAEELNKLKENKKIHQDVMEASRVWRKIEEEVKNVVA